MTVDLGQPRFLLLPYFLQLDGGFEVATAHDAQEGADLLREGVRARLAVLNTVVTGRRLAEAATILRLAAPGIRIAALRLEGSHREGVLPPQVDVCIHNALDVADVITAVELMLQDDDTRA